MPEIEVSDKEEIDFHYNLRVYFSFLKRYKGAALFLVLLAFVISSLDLVFNYAFKLIIDHSTQFIDKQMPLESFHRFLWVIFSVLLGITAVRAGGRWLYLRNINLLETELIRDVKQFYFNHLLTLSHGFHSSHKTGSLISRLSRGSGAVEAMTDVIIFQYVPLLFQIALVGASILYFTWSVGLVVFATSAAYIVYSVYLNEKQKRSNALYNNMSDH